MSYNNFNNNGNNNGNVSGNYGVSPQISVYKTGKKLLEFNSKLVAANPDHYASLHSAGDGAKSCIGMTLLDYSNGKGPNTVSVSVNLSPAQMEWWYTAVLQRHQSFRMEQEKIMSFKADANGVAPVTKVLIARNPIAHDGKPSRYPWYVSVENGTGRVQKNANGGTSIAPQSYVKTSQVFVNLNDEDMFAALRAVSRFVEVWEATVTPEIIRKGLEAYRSQQSQQTRPNTGKYTASEPQGYSQQAGGQTPGAGYSAQPAAPNPAAFVPGYNAAPYPAQQPQQPTNPYAYGAPGPAGYNGQ